MSNKTTIRGIDPDVYQDAKILAAHFDQPVGALITDAISEHVYDQNNLAIVEEWLDGSLGDTETTGEVVSDRHSLDPHIDCVQSDGEGE